MQLRLLAYRSIGCDNGAGSERDRIIAIDPHASAKKKSDRQRKPGQGGEGGLTWAEKLLSAFDFSNALAQSAT
jgi:hypothetical protein